MLEAWKVSSVPPFFHIDSFLRVSRSFTTGMQVDPQRNHGGSESRSARAPSRCIQPSTISSNQGYRDVEQEANGFAFGDQRYRWGSGFEFLTSLSAAEKNYMNGQSSPVYPPIPTPPNVDYGCGFFDQACDPATYPANTEPSRFSPSDAYAYSYPSQNYTSGDGFSNVTAMPHGQDASWTNLHSSASYHADYLGSHQGHNRSAPPRSHKKLDAETLSTFSTLHGAVPGVDKY